MEDRSTHDLTFEQVASLGAAVLQEVERAVVGKREVLELVLLGLLADGHVLIEDLPGSGQDAYRPLLRSGDLPDVPPHPVHPRPHAFGRDRRLHLQPEAGRIRVSSRPGVRQPAPRRRDQPRSGQDAGGPSRGDAGAAGDHRGHHPPAGAALPRACHPEPHRIRGHLPVARGAAGSLLAAHLGRLSGPRRRGPRAREARRASSRKASISSPWWTWTPCWRCSAPSSACTCRRASACTWSTSCAATRENRRVQVGSSPRGSLALYTLARARAVLRGRDFVTPEDVKDVAVPALVHRLTLRPELWVQRVPTAGDHPRSPRHRAHPAGEGRRTGAGVKRRGCAAPR